MKKFIESIKNNDYEILTDSGFESFEFIHKTIPYKVFLLKTEDGLIIKGADKHLLFDMNNNEIYIEDINIGSKIKTINGNSIVSEVIDTGIIENMYDFQLKENSNKRYYTNNILSHNTQLLRILSGLGVHGGNVTGQVLINEAQTPVQGGDMGIVFQDYYMPEHLKIHEMFKKSAKKNKTFKLQKINIEEEIQKIAAAFEITEHLEKYPSQLSGGQKQRANIAMQLLNGSNFILMDEPFSGLDPLMIDKTINLLRKVSLSDELKTFIIVSHDLENCIAIADTVFVLSDKGRAPGTGATIIKEIDLIGRDLAWHEDVKRMPAFHDTINEIKSLFA